MENYLQQVKKAKKGDTKAFAELYQQIYPDISMHLFAGYTSREMAELLHMNENTIRSKESRALKKLAGKLR